jgi:hypothetical protein
MTNSIKFSLIALIMTFAACAQRDGGDTGGGGKTIDPPAESKTWACRSGVDAEGQSYQEFNPVYLKDGSDASAYIVGDAPQEGIVDWFWGTYVKAAKDSGSGWYRYDLVGPEGSVFVLSFADHVDTVGTDASAWAQYGDQYTAAIVGPFRWTANAGSGTYGCSGIVHPGKLATPRS